MPRPLTLLLAVLLAGGWSNTLRAAPPADPFDQSNVPIEVQPADPKAVKIVLIAGAPDATTASGEHEHFAGSVLLMNMLRQSPGVFPVLAREWPKNPDTLKDARAVVFYMNGGAKQPLLQHADEVQKLADAGVGIVHVHQVIDYPTEPSKRAMAWLGGVYEPKTGARGHWVARYDQFPDHPVTRGVEPFSLMDGWILKLRFVPDLKGVTPLLRTHPPAKAAPAVAGKPAEAGPTTDSPDDIVCWTYDRPDGGRSFVFTGGHEQKNWGIPGLRRLVVNGILWTARVDVPKEGARVDLDPADIMTHLDRKPPKPKPQTKPAEK